MGGGKGRTDARWRACVSARHESGRAAPETTWWRAVGGRLHLHGVGRLRQLSLLDAQYGRAHPLQLRDHLLVVHLARERCVCGQVPRRGGRSACGQVPRER